MGRADNTYLNRYGASRTEITTSINVRQRLGTSREYHTSVRAKSAGLEVYEDDTQVVNRVIPTCLNEVDGVVMLPEVYLDSPRIAETPVIHVRRVHYGDIRIGVPDEDGVIAYPTTDSALAEMRARIQALYDSGADRPKVGARVSLIDLSKTREYAQYADLMQLELGDSVRAEYEGRTIRQRMVAYDWDCLRREYRTVTLGYVEPGQDALLARVATEVEAEARAGLREAVYLPLIQHIANMNEALANAVGMWSTTVTNADGSEMRYFHDAPTLEESTVIEYYPEPGTRVWTDTGWQDGSPVWRYGYLNNGLLVMRLLAVQGIDAEWVVVSGEGDTSVTLQDYAVQVTDRIDGMPATYYWWPEPPYRAGDVWHQPVMTTDELLGLRDTAEDYLILGRDLADYIGGNIYTCQTSRATGVFDRSDWVKTSSSEAAIRTAELTADGLRMQEDIRRNSAGVQSSQAQINLIDGALRTQVTQLSELTDIQASMQMTHDQWVVIVEQIQSATGNNAATLGQVLSYMRYGVDGLSLGASDSSLVVQITNQAINFVDGGSVVAWITGQQLYIASAVFVDDVTIGYHRIERYGNAGETTIFSWIGG